MSDRFNRRTVLRGASAAMALPLLESLSCSSNDRAQPPLTRKQGLAFPRRLIFFFTPQGNLELPSSMDFSGSMLEPLNKFRDRMVVLKGIDMASQDEGPGEPHQQGMAALTGRKLLDDGMFLGGCGNLRAGWASGISVDQYIASKLAEVTPRKLGAMNLGIQNYAQTAAEVRSVISYKGAKQPVVNEVNPWEVYRSVFSGLGADPLDLSRQLARRASVLDFAKDQFAAVKPNLSRDDKMKLDSHLQAVRELEKKLKAPGAEVGASCKQPQVGQPIDESLLNQPENLPAISTLQMDLAVMALACDLTRVVTLQWAAGINNRPYPFLSYQGKALAIDEHVTGHQPDSDTVAWGQLRVIREWYMGQLASLLQRLDNIPEGGGTMLDNTTVVWFSDVTRGNTHSHKDMPFLLCGGAGGAWKTNRMLEYENVPHNNLLVSLMNMMGVEGNTFGEPAHCTGPLAGLV